jgi:DegV family protein with EDD domain
MSIVAIVTDSVASIPESIIKTLNIQWVPYFIHWGKETLLDLVTVDRDSFYKRLPTVKTLPKTASPGPGDYVKIYKALADQGRTDIISIHMTSKGSGAFQSANIARSMIADELPNLRIKVIDTLNVSLCHGWMVIEAARAAMEGKSFTEVVEIVYRMVPMTHMIQTADTLKYLYLGGRIGRAKHLIGSIMNIKPLIGMQDGIIVPLGQVRSRQRAYNKMMEMVENAVGESGKIKIAYVHAAARDEALKLQDMFTRRLTIVEDLIAELSPALGVHTGPGTVGISYFPVID